jgi:hypothetical protein
MRRTVLFTAGAVFGLVLLACAPRPEGCPPEARGETRFSILALGDTGTPVHRFSAFGGQRTVGRALAEEDRRARADAFVFLGDNFYDRGLQSDEAEFRIRENLVRPYCGFVALDGPLSDRVREACATPTGPPRPMLAVLGNHDYKSPESPGLERELVPEYVTNWRIPEELASVVEVADGVSLILLDSERVHEGEDAAPLTEALRQARGPWRIIVAHRPIALDPPNPDSSAVDAAIEAAGVPVHAFVAGHAHNLQAWTGGGRVGIHVIAGSGAQIREIKPALGPRAQQDFARASLGFVRLDWAAGDDGEEQLIVSFVPVPRWPFEASGHRSARFVVDVEGRAESDASCSVP